MVARSVAPVMNGTLVLTGGAAFTVAVGALARFPLPSGFVAVTSTRSVAPTSAVTSSYVAPVAPAMFTHAPPVKRCHW